MVLRGIIKYYQGYRHTNIIEVEKSLSGSGGPIVVDSWRILNNILWNERYMSNHGGDYHDIALRARRLVEKLRRCMYDPIFVFSGLDPHQYINAKARAHPLLLIPVLLDVLRSMKVEIIQVDHHTVRTIVLLANCLHCPVLTNRTDFLGCLVEGGVALVLNENASVGLTDGDDKLGVDVFWHCRRFIETAGVTVDDFRIFSAVLTYFHTDLGTSADDWIPYANILEAIKNGEDLSFDDRVSGIFHEYSSSVDNANLQEFRDRAESYKLDDELHDYLVSGECRLLTYRGRRLPVQYQKRWRERKLPPYLMSVLSTRRLELPTTLQDPKQRSAFECSRPLREASYAILLGFDDDRPEETMKVGEEWVTVCVPVSSRTQSSPHVVLPRLEDIPTLKRKARREILFSVLGMDGGWRNGERIPPEYQFVLSVTCYWTRRTAVSTEHVRALLAALVKYDVHLQQQNAPVAEDDRPFSQRLSLRLDEILERKRLKILHTFTEWQTIFLDACQLNQLLLSPFGEPSPEFFHGSFLVAAVDMMREGDEFDVQIGEEFGEERYSMLDQLCQFVQQNTG